MTVFTDEEMAQAWKDANFGITNQDDTPQNRREFLHKSLCNLARGYSLGSTVTKILWDLGLIWRDDTHPTEKGLQFLQEHKIG
jgi:hypothetical protein